MEHPWNELPCHWVILIRFIMKSVPKVQIANKSTSVQEVAWCWTITRSNCDLVSWIHPSPYLHATNVLDQIKFSVPINWHLVQYNLWVLSTFSPRWRHQMETFSASLAICAGNSPVPGEFPSQKPVTRSFDVFFDLRLNKRLSKQSWGWWFETLSWSLWRHCNAPV